MRDDRQRYIKEKIVLKKKKKEKALFVPWAKNSPTTTVFLFYFSPLRDW